MDQPSWTSTSCFEGFPPSATTKWLDIHLIIEDCSWQRRREMYIFGPTRRHLSCVFPWFNETSERISWPAKTRSRWRCCSCQTLSLSMAATRENLSSSSSLLFLAPPFNCIRRYTIHRRRRRRLSLPNQREVGAPACFDGPTDLRWGCQTRFRNPF